MNFLKHTTTYISPNGTEYKSVRLQQYNEHGHKARNTFYIDGKKVTKHDRWICEQQIDNNCQASEFKTESWTK